MMIFKTSIKIFIAGTVVVLVWVACPRPVSAAGGIYVEDRRVLQADRYEDISAALDREERPDGRSRRLPPNASVLKTQDTPAARMEYDRDAAADTLLPKRRESRLDRLVDEKKPRTRREKAVAQDLDRLDLDFSMDAGLRRDQFRWTIAGDINGENPNILSELIWDDLWIYEVGGTARAWWDERFLVETGFDYGWIYKGNYQDSDYSGDNRIGEFSRSTGDSPGDDTWSTSAAVGYKFLWDAPEEWEDFLTDEVGITVLGGYSRRELGVKLENGFQDIPFTGPFSGLDSSYRSEWEGPWGGLELSGQRENVNGYARFEYHNVDYHAEANWNLRSDFQHPVSYTHDADGRGLVYVLGGDVAVNPQLSWGLKLKYQDWKTDAGVDRTFFSNGTSSDTQFNGAKWRSWGAYLTGRYQFQFGGAGKRPAPLDD